MFLLASLVSKNILELTDIGTDDFLSSGYYLKCMEQKCNDLNDYLLLTQKGALRTAEDEKRYLQYTNEFKQESTNFCYWYKINGVWYTNQPDTREGQQFDTQTVLMEAKTMGDYLLYDMEDKEFGTDIRGLENYFSAITAIRSTGPWKTWCLSSAWTHSFRQGMICGMPR